MRRRRAAADRRHEVREAARGWHRAGAIDERHARRDRRGPSRRPARGSGRRSACSCSCFTAIVVAASVFGLPVLALAVAANAAWARCSSVFGLLLAVAHRDPDRAAAARRRAAARRPPPSWRSGSCSAAGLAARARRGFHDDAWINVSLAVAVVLCGVGGLALGVHAPRRRRGRRALRPRRPRARRPLALDRGRPGAGGRCSSVPAMRRRSAPRTAARLVRGPPSLSSSSISPSTSAPGTAGGWRGSRRAFPTGPGSDGLRTAFGFATALVPLLTLAWGVRTRRRWLIALGALGIVASLVTLRHYVHVAPLWVVLIASGAATLAVAAALRRYLESGPGRRAGRADGGPAVRGERRPSVLEIAVAPSTPARPPDRSPISSPAAAGTAAAGPAELQARRRLAYGGRRGSNGRGHRAH